MSEELNPSTEPKTYSNEEISKILNTIKATREERNKAAARSKELETQVAQMNAQLEAIQKIDPERYQQLENLAKNYEESKLEEQKQFNQLKERWSQEKQTYAQQIQELQTTLVESKITNRLEKAFYSSGGRVGKDEDGYSYFDLIRDRASRYVQMDDDGKLQVVNPKDGTRMFTDKNQVFTVEDLMLKLRGSGPTAALFEPVGSGGSGMNKSFAGGNGTATRESLMGIKSRAQRLTEARRLGIK
ncbi:MAG: hypothetical protein QNJ36_19810 [Calothrix sp. MO_167.B42]|nr:hypothetical protein [Calothrix sp. MO_167.B42]